MSVKAGERGREKGGNECRTHGLACDERAGLQDFVEDWSDPSEGRLLEAPSLLKTLRQRRASLVHIVRRRSRSISSS